MIILKISFWVCVACVAYTYVLYPLLIALTARLRGRPVRKDGRFAGSVDIVLAAYNEESVIGRRLAELVSMLSNSGRDGRVIIVSDGSTDRTAALAREHGHERAFVLELPQNLGKAEALNRGCALARGDVIAFADARQRWAPDALEKLLQNFADPKVGAAGGDLVIESASDVLSGVGLYWRYEKWIRRSESLVHSTAGVTGAISAVRRELFHPIPKGTLLDDVYWPLQVVLQGYRVVHERQAVAFDRLPEGAGGEFSRKVRTLTGNFQLLMLLPAVLLPRRNPIWIQLFSHKVMRLAVPWALLVLLIVSALLPGPLYRLALVAQVAFYGLGVVGILQGCRSRLRLASAAGSFLLLNTAAWLAFWIWSTGRASSSWQKTSYDNLADKL